MDIQRKINQIRNTRIYILNLVQDLTTEQLNHVPIGLNNNIIWNIAHLTATQQNMCYIRCGLDISIDKKYFSPYLSGTKPDQSISKQEIDIIFDLLTSSLNQFEIDYANHIFIDFEPWDKKYGIKLNSIEDAIDFVPFHEGMHLGYIMALKKLIKGT